MDLWQWFCGALDAVRKFTVRSAVARPIALIYPCACAEPPRRAEPSTALAPLNASPGTGAPPAPGCALLYRLPR
jgi:hypothetical protein